MSSARFLTALAAASLVGSLASGCIPAAIGVGAKTGAAAVEERSLSTSIDDFRIRTEISRLWLARNSEMFRRATLNISEGRVMLTGIMPTTQMHNDALQATWQVPGVREVYDHIVVRAPEDEGNSSSTNDAWIQQKLKSRLLTDSEITSINYEIDVTDAVVYLLGIAQDQAELNRVVGHARDISGVRRVVPHIILKTDPRRTGS